MRTRQQRSRRREINRREWWQMQEQQAQLRREQREARRETNREANRQAILQLNQQRAEERTQRHEINHQIHAFIQEVRNVLHQARKSDMSIHDRNRLFHVYVLHALAKGYFDTDNVVLDGINEYLTDPSTVNGLRLMSRMGIFPGSPWQPQ